jgi:uncharacterized iron-regulated membrane protein
MALLTTQPRLTGLSKKGGLFQTASARRLSWRTATRSLVSFDSVALLARTSIPDATISNMQFQPSGLVRVQMKHPEDHTPAGRSSLFIDRYQGTVLRVLDTRTAEPGTRLMNLQRSLHTGDVFGLPTQIIWLLSVLVLASQGLTGVLMWWNGRRARRAQKERAVRYSWSTALAGNGALSYCYSSCRPRLPPSQSA